MEKVKELFHWWDDLNWYTRQEIKSVIKSIIFWTIVLILVLI